MTWSVLLSTHIHPILREERPLLLLALLERAGLATEEALEAASGVGLPRIRTILYQLQLNRLVEFGTRFVRLTEHGRDTLDRLDLFDEVLQDCVDSLEMPDNWRPHCVDALRVYRRSAYRLYQNSLSTLSAWDRLVSEAFKADPSLSRKASILGKRCFLYRDLRHWRWQSLSKLTSLEAQQADYDGNRLAAMMMSDSSQAPSHDLGFDYREFQKQWQESCDSVVQFTTPWQHRLSEGEAGLVFIKIMELHSFQAHSEPDVWFDKWAVECKAPRTRTPDVVAAERAARKSLHARETMAAFRASWRSQGSEPLADSFVVHLAGSQSLVELARRLDLPEASTELLLREVQVSCERLLRRGKRVPPRKPSSPAFHSNDD